MDTSLLPGVIAGVLVALITASVTIFLARQALAAARQAVVDAAKREDTLATRSDLQSRVTELKEELAKANAKSATFETELRLESEKCKNDIAALLVKVALLESETAAKVVALESTMTREQMLQVSLEEFRERNRTLTDQMVDLLVEQRIQDRALAGAQVAQAGQAALVAQVVTAAQTPPTETPSGVLAAPQVILRVTPDLPTASPEMPMAAKAPPDGT
jgi:FtsZ-binding cell division protein ZapB